MMPLSRRQVLMTIIGSGSGLALVSRLQAAQVKIVEFDSAGHSKGAETVDKGVRRVEAVEHLVGDLRVARLVRTNKTEAIAAENGDEAIEQEKENKAENEGYLEDRGLGGQASARGRLRVRRRRFQLSLHA